MLQSVRPELIWIIDIVCNFWFAILAVVAQPTSAKGKSRPDRSRPLATYVTCHSAVTKCYGSSTKFCDQIKLLYLLSETQACRVGVLAYAATRKWEMQSDTSYLYEHDQNVYGEIRLHWLQKAPIVAENVYYGYLRVPMCKLNWYQTA